MYNADTLMQALELERRPVLRPRKRSRNGAYGMCPGAPTICTSGRKIPLWAWTGASPSPPLGAKPLWRWRRLGFAEHVSQQTFFKVEDYGPYDCRKFGLYRSLVGLDIQGGDFFENLAAGDLSDSVPPGPEARDPEPVSEPEPERTRTLPGWTLLAGMVGAVALARGHDPVWKEEKEMKVTAIVPSYKPDEKLAGVLRDLTATGSERIIRGG